jgi:CheY-like chemotaxis protein
MSRHIIAVVDDLFFAAKIRGTAEQVGVPIIFSRTIEAVVEKTTANAPALIICDLNSQRIDPFELAANLKQNQQTASIPLLGFFSHVQVELQRKAIASGFDRVVPRSVFASSLVEILKG